MSKPSILKQSKTENKPRRPLYNKKTKVLSGRIMQARVQELKELYPKEMTESEIINDLVKEKLERAKFDKWIKGLSENFNLNDFDLDSLR